jgi:hypothetical protein
MITMKADFICMCDRSSRAAATVIACVAIAGCSSPMRTNDSNTKTPSAKPLMCDLDRDMPELAVQMIPAAPPKGPGVFLLYQIGAACEGLGPRQVLLQNTSQSALTIDAVGSSDEHFSVTAEKLPHTLEPDAMFPIFVDFESDMPGEFPATLAVAGPEGCVELPIKGQAVDAAEDGVSSFAPYVMDFGSVPVGTTSEVQELTVLVQPKTSADGAKATGFSTTSEQFEVVSAPPESGFSKDCQRLKVGVRFVAPATAGTVHEHLGWSVLTSLDGSEFEATIISDLVAVAK